MAARFLLAAALCPFALAFSDTVPLLAWSSYSSTSLDRLPSNAGHSQSLLKSLLLNEDVCEADAVILVEQQGLHASDLRTLSPSSKLVQILAESSSQRQFQYVTASTDADLATLAKSVSTRCGSRLINVTPTSGSPQGYFSHDARNVVSINLPSLEGEVGGTRRDKVSLYASQLADELAYLTSTFPKHLVVYTGTLYAQYERRQTPGILPPARPVFDSVYAPVNTTLPEGGILKRYQLLTPGLISVLLISFFILVPIVMMGFSALASIQSPLRVEAPKGYSAGDKKTQ